MKKSLLILSIFSLFFITSYVIAQTVPPMTSDPSSGCTGFESTENCHPEWAEALSVCIPGSVGVVGPNTCKVDPIKQPEVAKMQPNISICSATNMSAGTPCRPTRVSIYASQTIARQAEAYGKQLGYTISCLSQKQTMLGNIDPNTGLTYFMNVNCTINGESGFSFETVTEESFKSVATELKQIEATKTCGTYHIPSWNSDGTYKCVDSPYYTDTCVGAENYNKFNYVTGKYCNATTTTTPPPPVYTPSTTTGWTTAILNLLNNIKINLKSQLDAIGTDGTQSGTSGSTSLQSTASYVTSVSNILNNMSSNLKNQLSSIGTGQAVTQTTTTLPSTQTGTQTQTTLPSPIVDLTLSTGLKSGAFSVGDTIGYKVTMQNVDSVSSYYTATPGDTCVGGSNSGEQKSWVVSTVSPSSTFNGVAAACQTGNTYIISVIGKNTASGKVAASSISVYIK